MDLEARQRALCDRYGSAFAPPFEFDKVGIARNVAADAFPLNALRHPPDEGTSGWFIWSGIELDSTDDFFEPLHISHLGGRCPGLLDYLALPPGWRILLAPGHQDAWFDEKLLEI